MQSYIPSTSPLLSERDLEAQIRQALNNHFTGEIHITFLFGKTETIFAIQGHVRQVYIRNHRVPDLEWKTPIERYGAGTLMFESMSARALMFRKIVLEETVAAKPINMGTRKLQSMFDMAKTNPGPTLFHIRWEHARAFVFVAGGRIPIGHAVLTGLFESDEWKVVIDHISERQEESCDVTICRGDIKNQAWLELHLNTLFEWHCQNILSYYLQLTGAIMVRSLLQNMYVLAESKGWDVSTKNHELRYASIFPSAAEAYHAYKEVLSAIQSRIEPIIGNSLTMYLMKQSTESITGIYKTIEEVFHLVEETP